MQSIYQYRGFASCLKEGFRHVLAYPWTTTKEMGLWALGLSFLFVLDMGMLTKFAADFLFGSVGPSSALGFYGMGILTIVVLVLGIYSFYRYGKRMAKMDRPDGKVKKTKVIFGHFWSFLGVVLMAMFLSILISFIPYLPCYVSNDAYWSCVFAQAEFNDAVTIPTGGYVLMFVVSVISMAVSYLLSLVFPACIMYKYGSLYSLELNKQK